jgi:hypothetical protein
VSVSVILRLATESLAEGRLAGEAELVMTGDRALITSTEQLVAFVSAHLEEQRGPALDA